MADLHVFHFDRIYNSQYAAEASREAGGDVGFTQIDYGRPPEIGYSDVYFVRRRESHRVGYHSMCEFSAMFYYYPRAAETVQMYDMAMRVDDDSMWIGTVSDELINRFEESDSLILSFNSYKYNLSHRSRAFRKEQVSLLKRYCSEYGITPKHEWVQRVVAEDDPARALDIYQENLVIHNTTIYKLKPLFGSSHFRRFMQMVRDEKGIWTHRWADHELITLFHDIHFETPVMLATPVNEGCCPSQTQYLDFVRLKKTDPIAPGVQQPRRVFEWKLPDPHA